MPKSSPLSSSTLRWLDSWSAQLAAIKNPDTNLDVWVQKCVSEWVSQPMRSSSSASCAQLDTLISHHLYSLPTSAWWALINATAPTVYDGWINGLAHHIQRSTPKELDAAIKNLPKAWHKEAGYSLRHNHPEALIKWTLAIHHSNQTPDIKHEAWHAAETTITSWRPLPRKKDVFAALWPTVIQNPDLLHLWSKSLTASANARPWLLDQWDTIVKSRPPSSDARAILTNLLSAPNPRLTKVRALLPCVTYPGDLLKLMPVAINAEQAVLLKQLIKRFNDHPEVATTHHQSAVLSGLPSDLQSKFQQWGMAQAIKRLLHTTWSLSNITMNQILMDNLKAIRPDDLVEAAVMLAADESFVPHVSAVWSDLLKRLPAPAVLQALERIALAHDHAHPHDPIISENVSLPTMAALSKLPQPKSIAAVFPILCAQISHHQLSASVVSPGGSGKSLKM